MTAAIYYHPEAYTTSGPKLMGRNAAGESFLRGFFAHSRASELWAQVETPAHGQHFAQAAAEARPGLPVHTLTRAQLGALAQPGCVYYPGPGIGEHAWHRSLFGHARWSLCGITHTTSSDRAMDAIAEWVTAPVQPWDTVICTSTAVKANVERILQAQVDHLVQRLSVQRLAATAPPWPARLDPTASFAGYATQSLTPATWLTLTRPDLDTAAQMARIASLRRLSMVDFAKLVLPSEDDTGVLLRGLADGGQTAETLLGALPAERRAAALRGLVWLMKMGVVGTTPPPPQPLAPPLP